VTYVVIYKINAEFLVKGIHFTKIAFVQMLRLAFQTQTFYPEFKYDPKDVDSMLSVVEAWPRRVLKAPAIAVSIGGMIADRSSLQPTEEFAELRDANNIPVGVFSSGILNMTVRLEIFAITNSDCRKVTDLTMLFCRNLFQYKMAEFGIGYKNIRTVGESTISWQGQLLHMNTLELPCTSEYQVMFPSALWEAVNKLHIDLYDDGSGYKLNEFNIPEP